VSGDVRDIAGAVCPVISQQCVVGDKYRDIGLSI